VTVIGSRVSGLPTLEGQLARARQMLGEKGDPGAAAADQAGHALREASDALMAILAECGVETPLGWRLHQLRSRLDAHLLAASALADAEVPDAVVAVMRRSIELVTSELEELPRDWGNLPAPFSRVSSDLGVIVR
jgi:hypothetical protein